jgi:putative PIN family toxin of toxin-antitoxin system
VGSSEYRIVLDTNTLLRGLASESSAAAKVLRAAEDRIIIPLLSKPVLDEYRAVLNDPSLIARLPSLNPKLTAIVLHRLRYIGDYVTRPKAKFLYARDPGDQKFIEVAIGLRATHIITSDNDLLALPKSQTDAGRRFQQRLPGVLILSAIDFLTNMGREYNRHN